MSEYSHFNLCVSKVTNLHEKLQPLILQTACNPQIQGNYNWLSLLTLTVSRDGRRRSNFRYSNFP
jgi:hypothetical protein